MKGKKGRVRIFYTVRNRLELTKYTIKYLFKNTKDWEIQLFLYDNLSNLDLKKRFIYYSELIDKKKLAQFTFNTKHSTNRAFSKVAANNQFADFHNSSLDKKSFKYVIMMDNDMLCLPGWLDGFDQGWQDVDSDKGLRKKILAVTQNPGGVMARTNFSLNGRMYWRGRHGGSGLWVVKPNFFERVGKLDLQKVVGEHKRHDQEYWRKMQETSGWFEYVLTLPCHKVMHLGGICGSVCNFLTAKKPREDLKKLDLGFEKLKHLTPEQIAEKYPKFFNW